MRAVTIGIAGVVLAGAAVACKFPLPTRDDNCQIVCGSLGQCPPGMLCGHNNYCYLEAGQSDPMCSVYVDAGADADALGTIDAAPPPDADPDQADLRIGPASYDFESTLVGGQSSAASFEVTNVGLHTSGLMTATLATGDSDQFTIVNDDCSGSALDGSAGCTVNVAFMPSEAGEKISAIQVTASPGGVASAGLSGTAGALGMFPAAQDFGTIETGSSSSGITFTVTTPAFGTTGELTVSLAGTDAGEFGLENDHCNGVTLGSGSNCTVTVVFTPNTTGDKSATLVASGDPGGEASATLTGNAFSAAR